MTAIDIPLPPAPSAADISGAIRAAAARVAPVWPLDRFVAVNPYVGLASEPVADAAARLARTAGTPVTLPVGWYLARMDEGRISRAALADALVAAGQPDDVDAFLARARRSSAGGGLRGPAAPTVPTVARIATDVTGRDWAGMVVDRVTAWAAAHFDDGQALWRSADGTAGVFASWKSEASVDRTPEVLGLKGVRRAVRALPDDHRDAAVRALRELALPAALLDDHLDALLATVGGWAAWTARLAFEARLAGGDDDAVEQLLAVLVCWEWVLLGSSPGTDVAGAWHDAVGRHAATAVDGAAMPAAWRDALVLQDAFDRTEQRALAAAIERGAPAAAAAAVAAPRAQLVWCIDVRSEVMRRHLEAVAPDVETLGFAGFFGFAVDHVALGHDHGEARCPVLLTPAVTVCETLAEGRDAVTAIATRRRVHHVRKAWKSFKMGAITCFSFVGPVGLAYLPKLFTDAAGRTRPVRRAEVEALPGWACDVRRPDVAALPLPVRADLATGALRAMSLTTGFAPLVVLTGHGATTTNNPYDSGLGCGACGGHAGDVSAMVTAAACNDPEVRAVLAERGIAIPTSTWFVAALHDTTTDRVAVLGRADVPATHTAALRALEADLAEAGRRARRERAPRLGLDPDAAHLDDAVIRRSTDWAQVRPEWGLAGCRAFVAAPRHRTRGLDLEGRAFLHSYDWRVDEGFGVLELILTAPVVVASWINLQYLGSTVAPDRFGAGDKTLHNVVGRVGVVEGTSGDLRVGLPWQSVHDGERYQHEPLRLHVLVEAPTSAIEAVLDRHDHVRHLCDNGWVQLSAITDDGTVTARSAGGWHRLDDAGPSPHRVA